MVPIGILIILFKKSFQQIKKLKCEISICFIFRFIFTIQVKNELLLCLSTSSEMTSFFIIYLLFFKNCFCQQLNKVGYNSFGIMELKLYLQKLISFY